MNVTRDVILDLLPIYLGGEASPASVVLIEEYLQQDPELAQHVRALSAQSLTAQPVAPAPEVELRSLRRTRTLLGWQRWLFGLGIAFTALALTSEVSFEGGRLREFHFLIRDYPQQLGACALLALLCWSAYYSLRRRLRSARPDPGQR
jgi:predicted anti-sigma-YlaC factor YlaD